MAELLAVGAVEVVANYRLRLTFADGSTGEVDFSDRQWRGIFEPLQDPGYFRQVAVDPELGTIVWPNAADIPPETLYELAVGRRLSV